MGVTTITADPFCKEQNNAGFEEIIVCSGGDERCPGKMITGANA
jgi:hypothetical protein